MRNYQPHNVSQNENLITRVQGDLPNANDFGQVWNDLPASTVPQNGLYYLENYRSLRKRTIPRPGTKAWSDVPVPLAIATYALNQVYVHKRMNKICLHQGTFLYISDPNTILWIQAYPNSMNTLTDGYSVMYEADDWLFIHDSNGRIFKCDLNHSISGSTTISATDPYCYYQVNTNVPSYFILPVAKTSTLVYGRKYTYGMARLRGSLFSNRSTPLVIEQLSGTLEANSSFEDFSTIFTSRPVGDNYSADTTTHLHYGVLTGDSLGASYNTAAEWAVITNGQFTISIDGTSKNVVVNFTGCLTMTDVADKIQDALRTYFPATDVTCKFLADGLNGYFSITSPNPGGTVSVTSAGSGGTDIGTAAMSCQAGTGTVDNSTNYYTNSIIGDPDSAGAKSLRVPVDPDGSGVYQKHWTHFSVYGTLDIGENGIDAETGNGNNSELFVWIADIPICKAFAVSYAIDLTLTALAGTFSIEDIGTKVKVWKGAAYATFTIASFTSSAVVTVAANAETALAGANACLGSDTAIGVIQGDDTTPTVAGTVMTRLTGSAFTSADVGKTVFWSDGTTSLITGYTDASTVTVYPSKLATATALAGRTGYTLTKTGTTVTKTVGTNFSAADTGAVIKYDDGSCDQITAYISTTQVTVGSATARPDSTAASVCYVKAITITPITRKFNDTISDEILKTRILGFLLENRFYVNLPAVNTGYIARGFMFGAYRGTNFVYYSPFPEDKQYLGGYYKKDLHVARTKDKISTFLEYPDMLAVICYNSTYNIPVNTFITKQIKNNTGIVVDTIYLISAMTPIDSNIGCIDFTSIVKLNNGNYRMITTEGYYREFNGSGYSVNLAENKFTNKLKALKAGSTSSFYDMVNGILIWGRNNNTGSAPNVCYQLGVLPEQGEGWSENTGADWVFVPQKIGVIQITDSNNNVRTLALDGTSGLFYAIDSRDGPANSGISKIWKDKVASDGSGGTAVAGVITFGEDRGTYEHFLIKLKEAHFYVRPTKESNRNASGYDANGYLIGFYLDITIFVDGEPTTATATADDITVLGDIVFDKNVEGHRIQCKITSNMGDHQIVGRQQYYVAKNKPATPNDLVTTEQDNQAAFAEPDVWIDVCNAKVIDRVDGTEIIASPTLTTGVDSNISAFTISAALACGSTTLGATGTLLLWKKTADTIAVTIGGVAVTLTLHGTSGDWSLYYANTVNKTGALVITPTGSASIMDVRAINSAISTVQKTYYYSDLTANSGKIMGLQ